jgi:hypothetical protein
MKKNLTTQNVEVFTLFKGNHFVASDFGNYSAVEKKDGSIVDEEYDGDLNEYLRDYDVSRPIARKSGYLKDVLKTSNIKYQ